MSGCAAAAAEAAASLKVPLAAEVLSAIAAAPPAAGEGGEIMHFVALLLVGCAAGLVSRSATGGILTALHGDAKAGAQAATAGGDAGTARAASDLKLADSPGHGSGKENVDPVAPGTPPRTFAASGKKGAASPPDCGEGWQSAFDEEKPAERCENRAKAARLYVAGRNAARLSRAACIGGLQVAAFSALASNPALVDNVPALARNPHMWRAAHLLRWLPVLECRRLLTQAPLPPGPLNSEPSPARGGSGGRPLSDPLAAGGLGRAEGEASHQRRSLEPR